MQDALLTLTITGAYLSGLNSHLLFNGVAQIETNTIILSKSFTYGGVGVSIDIYNGEYNLLSDFQLCGIYCLWLGDLLVYIGQSESIMERIFKHKYEKEFDGFTFFVCEKHELNEVEAQLILEHQPLYNRSIPVNKDFISYNQIKRQYGFSKPEIKRMVLGCGIEPIAFKNSLFVKTAELSEMGVVA